jgi:hypothetical protein
MQLSISRRASFVMTGTLTPIIPIVRGSSYVGRFSTLGDIETRFV